MPIELPADISLLDNISTITVSFRQLQARDQDHEPARQLRAGGQSARHLYADRADRAADERDPLRPQGLLDTLVPEQVVIEIDAEDFYVAAGQQNIACRLYVPSNGKIFATGQLCHPVQDRK